MHRGLVAVGRRFLQANQLFVRCLRVVNLISLSILKFGFGLEFWLGFENSSLGVMNCVLYYFIDTKSTLSDKKWTLSNEANFLREVVTSL
jgi:hypothetical protein